MLLRRLVPFKLGPFGTTTVGPAEASRGSRRWLVEEDVLPG